mgnify:CR=1 FL=1
MHHQSMRSETPVITAIVNRALALGFDLEVADEDRVLLARSHHLPELLATIGNTKVTGLTVLEPRPSRRRIGALVLTQAGKNPEELLTDIQCDGEAALAILEDIAHARAHSH